MTIATILCQWIYGTFLALKVALEAGVLFAKKIMNVIEAALKAFSLFTKGLMQLTIQKVIEACKVIMKTVTDLLIPWDVKSSLICTSLYKCSFVLEKLLDPSSLIVRTLKQFGNYDASNQAYLFGILKEYNKFKAQICNFGFTIELGLGALRDLLMGWKAQIEGFIEMVMNKYDYFHRLIQSYLDKVIDFGIGDLLENLSKLFNCVILDSVETCASIATSSSFYKWTTSSLNIEQCGPDFYQMKPSFIEGKLNWIKSLSLDLGTVNKKLEAMLDTMMSPASVAAASNAFNLMNICKAVRQIRNEGRKQMRIQKEMKGSTSDLKEAWMNTFTDKEGLDTVSDNYLLSNTNIDPITGRVTIDGVEVNGSKIVGDANYDLYPNADLGSINPNAIMATDNGLVSVAQAAKACLDVEAGGGSATDKTLYDFCKKAANTVNNLYEESELVVRL